MVLHTIISEYDIFRSDEELDAVGENTVVTDLNKYLHNTEIKINNFSED